MDDLIERYALVRLPVALLAKHISLPASAIIEAAEVNMIAPGEVTFRLRGVGRPLIGALVDSPMQSPIEVSETNDHGQIVKEALVWPRLT